MLLAKSNGTTLADHISHVFTCIEEMRRRDHRKIPMEWWQAACLAAIYHDLGKIDSDFQRMLIYRSGTAFPHSLLSLLFFIPDENSFSSEIMAAVAFHHWRNSFPGILLGMEGQALQENAAAILDRYQEYENTLEELKEELGKSLPETDLSHIQINRDLVEYLRWNSLGDSGMLLPPYTLNFVPDYIRLIHGAQKDREKSRIFLSGTLMRADHYASLVEDSAALKFEEIENGVLPDFEIISQAMENSFPEFWQGGFFKSHPELKGSDLIFVGGTGVGKTEFSYLWAAGHKALMILPMQAAVNKLWERSRDFFRGIDSETNQNVGLLHGNASLYIREDKEYKDDAMLGRGKPAINPRRRGKEYKDEAMKTVLLARHLANSFIIATADQIAPAALRYPGYERIFAALMEGHCLIVDEIQAYNPKAAAIMTGMLELNHFFGGQSLVMTATLPPFIREELEKRLQLNPEQIIDLFNEKQMHELGNSRRHTIRFSVVQKIDNLIPKIIEQYHQKKKVLVIFNTVKAAQAFYDQIKKHPDIKRLLLLHSRYTADDRKSIEKELTEDYLPNKDDAVDSGCIVVATQVVEASLDIDADLMYTEAAPADSLVQRMGRVWRHYARSTGNIAPQEANVIVMIPSGDEKPPKKDGKDQKNYPPIGYPVYDRDLVAVTLALLASYGQGNSSFENGLSDISDNWSDGFRKKIRDKKEAYDQKIIKKLASVTCSFSISETDKKRWVEETFRVIAAEADNAKGLYLGNYLKDYRETLNILDHGYCSDSRFEAQRIFRPILDVEGIPAGRIPEFKDGLQQWLLSHKEGDRLKASYVDLADEVLLKYVVNCPHYNNNVEQAKVEPLYLSDFVHQQPLLDKDKRRVEQWLDGLFRIDRIYSKDRGLDMGGS